MTFDETSIHKIIRRTLRRYNKNIDVWWHQQNRGYTVNSQRAFVMIYSQLNFTTVNDVNFASDKCHFSGVVEYGDSEFVVWGRWSNNNTPNFIMIG